MKKLIPFIIFISAAICQSQIKIDHIPIVVKNLENAEKQFVNTGFAIKAGYLHKNGILNSHIKFSDKTSLEIISLVHNKDEISNSYADFLKQKEGGTYLALKTENVKALSKVLNQNNIKHKIISGKIFTYITFSGNSHKHIFIIKYNRKFKEQRKYISHKNSVSGIKGVVISGDSETIKLLETLFAVKAENNKIKLFDDKFISVKFINTQNLFRVSAVKLKNFRKEISICGLRIN